MKKYLTSLGLALLLMAPAYADVVKRTKSEVTFKGFGTFKSEQTERIASDKKLTDSKNEFKGKGIAGRLAGKFALKSGEEAELVDLTARTISSMNRKKKEYSVRPITPLGGGDETTSGTPTKEDTEAEEMESSPVRIMRSEFKVEKTGETKTLNRFPSQKYLVTWITEWEDTDTGQKGTDRMVTEVWTTALSGEAVQARKEETQFSQQYMSLLGLDSQSLKQDVLGTNWLKALSGLSGESSRAEDEGDQIAAELQKIEGYPVVIDGKYYAVREGGEQDEAQEEQSSGLGGALGRFAKKTIKGGNKKDSDEPNLAFKTEILELKAGRIEPKGFEIPADYKEKK